MTLETHDAVAAAPAGATPTCWRATGLVLVAWVACALLATLIFPPFDPATIPAQYRVRDLPPRWTAYAREMILFLPPAALLQLLYVVPASVVMGRRGRDGVARGLNLSLVVLVPIGVIGTAFVLLMMRALGSMVH